MTTVDNTCQCCVLNDGLFPSQTGNFGFVGITVAGWYSKYDLEESYFLR